MHPCSSHCLSHNHVKDARGQPAADADRASASANVPVPVLVPVLVPAPPPELAVPEVLPRTDDNEFQHGDLFSL